MKHNPGKKIGMIFFDAQIDTAEHTSQELSNCTAPPVLLKDGYLEGKNIVQIGIRGCLNPKSEKEVVEKNGNKNIWTRGI